MTTWPPWEENTAGLVILGHADPGWNFLSGGIILGIATEEMLLLLIFGGLGALLLIMAFFSPIFEWFEFDQAAQSFKFYQPPR